MYTPFQRIQFSEDGELYTVIFILILNNLSHHTKKKLNQVIRVNTVNYLEVTVDCNQISDFARKKRDLMRSFYFLLICVVGRVLLQFIKLYVFGVHLLKSVHLSVEMNSIYRWYKFATALISVCDVANFLSYLSFQMENYSLTIPENGRDFYPLKEKFSAKNSGNNVALFSCKKLK